MIKDSERSEYFDENDYDYNASSKTGIMLIHGFSSTTYEFKKLAKFLSERNIFVRFENLPGHGTTVDDCNSYQYMDWIKFVEMRFADMASRCDRIYVLGISMGALLAMHLSVLFPVNGLIAAAPILKFNKPFKVHILNRLFCRVVQYRSKKYEFHPSQQKCYGYNKWPLISLNEVRKLSNYVSKDIVSKISCPSLFIHSKMDYTSIYNNHLLLKGMLDNQNINYLIVDKSPHNMFDCDIEKEVIQSTIINFINNNDKAN